LRRDAITAVARRVWFDRFVHPAALDRAILLGAGASHAGPPRRTEDPPV
jgi:hypothetical protein